MERATLSPLVPMQAVLLRSHPTRSRLGHRTHPSGLGAWDFLDGGITPGLPLDGLWGRGRCRQGVRTF
jgi:hypothetical protein